MDELMKEARAWIADCIDSCAPLMEQEDALEWLERVGDRTVKQYVEKNYCGGWESFIRAGG